MSTSAYIAVITTLLKSHYCLGLLQEAVCAVPFWDVLLLQPVLGLHGNQLPLILQLQQLLLQVAQHQHSGPHQLQLSLTCRRAGGLQLLQAVAQQTS